MQALNHALFLWFNAPEQPPSWAVALAVLLAEHLIWALPLLLVTGWLLGREHIRQAMLAAALAAGLGLLLNQPIGLAWANPRPFVIGLGHTLIPHAADPSFPSDHLTLWWATAFGLLLQPGLRGWGAALALLGLPIAWARVYLGVHYPLDMAGALAMGGFSAWLSRRSMGWYMQPLYRAACRLHQACFGGLIARGWLRE
ncbi:MAG: undecaprenyl-diphosphatase [Comamonadaceae bacterium]|jgi:undecaprenyl-diphosphatase|nr:undecaprenyl-diphosphatase [Comamonadaceae bacterium]